VDVLDDTDAGKVGGAVGFFHLFQCYRHACGSTVDDYDGKAEIFNKIKKEEGEK